MNVELCFLSSPQPDETTFTFSQAVLKADSTAAQQKACGVCLLNVDCPQRGGTPSGGEDTPKLSYGGRQYHAPCANFWVNCVDSMLPSLKLPELLWMTVCGNAAHVTINVPTSQAPFPYDNHRDLQGAKVPPPCPVPHSVNWPNSNGWNFSFCARPKVGT